MPFVDTPTTSGPSVTVITVVYNGGTGIEKTIQSVLAQAYPQVQYIVMDGGSTDGTMQIIDTYRDRIAVVVSQPDKGIYDAMNKCVAMATGEWINFMNAGDCFASPSALEIFNQDFKGCDVVYGDAIKEYATFEVLFKKFPLKSMWREMPFSHQGTFVRTSLMREFGFDEAYKLSADYDFLFRAYRAGKKFLYVDRIIARVDFREGASKASAVRSISERKHSALKNDFSIWKWLYYLLYLPFVRLKIAVKERIGENRTSRVTEILRMKSRW